MINKLLKRMAKIDKRIFALKIFQPEHLYYLNPPKFFGKIHPEKM